MKEDQNTRNARIETRYPFERSLGATHTYFTLFDDPKTSNFLRNGNDRRKKKKNKRKKKDVRTIHDDGGISVNTLCLSIDRDTLRAQYKQRKRDKNHSLPIFAIGVRAYSSIAFSSIGYSGERKKKKKEKKK